MVRENEIGETPARARGFCHAAEVLFIPPQCSCWYETLISAMITNYTRRTSAVSPSCTLSHLMPTISLGKLSLRVLILLVQFQSMTRSVFLEKQPELMGCPPISNGIVSVSGKKPRAPQPAAHTASHIVEGDQRVLGSELSSWVSFH